MKSKYPDETLRMRWINLNLCILCMLEDTFSLGVSQIFPKNPDSEVRETPFSIKVNAKLQQYGRKASFMYVILRLINNITSAYSIATYVLE